jgi:hypothetical protein
LDALYNAIKDTTNPKFVYAHIMLPHDPFFFKEDGDILPDSERDGASSRRNKNNYLEQLKFTNKKIIESINLIFSQKKNDPIVIIQADHGYRYLDKNTGGQEEDHSILFAAHLPDLDSTKEADDVTGVNLFRRIFNDYFGFAFPILEHEEYFVPIVED